MGPPKPRKGPHSRGKEPNPTRGTASRSLVPRDLLLKQGSGHSCDSGWGSENSASSRYSYLLCPVAQGVRGGRRGAHASSKSALPGACSRQAFPTTLPLPGSLQACLGLQGIKGPEGTRMSKPAPEPVQLWRGPQGWVPAATDVTPAITPVSACSCLLWS